MFKKFLFAYLLTFAFAYCHLSAQFVPQPLKTIEPAAIGYSASFFKDLEKELNDSIPCLGSFIVWKDGGIIFEKYFHGATDQTSFDIKSITKSMVSATAGVMYTKGLLPDLQTPAMKFFPEYAKSRHATNAIWFADEKANHDSVRNRLTLQNLLTMQPGFEWSDFGPVVNAFINSSDPVRFTLELPFENSPGTRFVYCSAAASVFAAALAKIVKTDLKAFAKRNLFDPAGMTLRRWDIDPMGRYVGASEMYMTTRDLLRFGLLYLNEGKIGNRQIISKEWIRESVSEQAELNYWDILPGANGYGYFWWRRITNGRQAWIASGAGGQIVTVVPDLKMIVVANCLFNEANRGREEIKRIHLFVDKVTGQLNRKD